MTLPAAVIVLLLALAYYTQTLALEQKVDLESFNISNTVEPVQAFVKDTDNDNNDTHKVIRTNVDRDDIDRNSFKLSNQTNYHNSKDNAIKFDDIFKELEDDYIQTSELYFYNAKKLRNWSNLPLYLQPKKRVKREDEQDPRCEKFLFDSRKNYITHPHEDTNKDNFYYGNINCVTNITGPEGTVIKLTFVDMFNIEYHPDCDHDYLEIRDGERGYGKLLTKVCGDEFPPEITSSGPNIWLKFYSDDTIETEGFRINFEFIQTTASFKIPSACINEKLKDLRYGEINSSKIDSDCVSKSEHQPLDGLWRIQVPKNHRIFLNFTVYSLAKPNACEENLVQVFGHILEYDASLATYCGSKAEPVMTRGDTKHGNIMYVRYFATKNAKTSIIVATFNAFRTLSPDEKCDEETEFDCEDNTCIDASLKCQPTAYCRLKTDQEKERCSKVADSMLKETHIQVILSIFSLILSGICFVFMFKCAKKMYNDHKIIKDRILQSCEDRFSTMVSDRLLMDAKKHRRDSGTRISNIDLERDNLTNELFKQQKKIPHQKLRPTSIDSDFVPETHIDLDDDPWREEVNNVIVDTKDIKSERRSKSRNGHIKKKEKSKNRHKESEEGKQTIDVSVGTPDYKNSGVQTRESLFQTDPVPSSNGSGTTYNRESSAFGHSGTTVIHPSSSQNQTSQVTIELIKQASEQEKKTDKKIYPDRRPMSTETTRSAPDVIIVAKPTPL